MNKTELLNKLNNTIDEKFHSELRNIFNEMIKRENEGKDIDTYINIETGEIFTEVYNGWDPIEKNPHVLQLGTHKGCDATAYVYECMNNADEMYITRELGIFNEWLDNDENGCMSFRELLEATGKLEDFEENALDNCFYNWDLYIRDLTEEDLRDLDTDHINL